MAAPRHTCPKHGAVLSPGRTQGAYQTHPHSQQLPPRPTCEPPARGMTQVSRFPTTLSRPTFRPSTWMA